MNFMDKLIRSLKDDYKVGVEASAKAPVIYLNPDALDSWSAERVLKLKVGAPLSREDQLAKKILSEQITQQLDEQSPGLSSKLSKEEIEGLYFKSLIVGPFADFDLKKHGVNIVNMPKDNQIDKERILNTFGIIAAAPDEPQDPNDPYDQYMPDTSSYQSFNPKHLKPLPGSTSAWKELIGQHEGEHVNQELTLDKDSNPGLIILDREVRSDRSALAGMRAKGEHVVAQAFADLRAISAAEGDHTHATGIFLDQDGYKGATLEHRKAALQFKDEMVGGVAAELGIFAQEAEKLRKTDPQKFVRVLDEALQHGRIPTPKEIPDYEKKEKIIIEMGLSETEFNKLGSDRVADVLKAHDKLKGEGAFKAEPQENPHVKEYIETYSSAVKRLFVEDTTPDAETKPTPAPSIAKRSTEQVIATLSPEELRQNAKNQFRNAMYDSVAERLNITKAEAGNLRFGNADEKSLFFEALEAQLKDGNIKGQILRTKTETEALLKKSMNVSDEEFARIKQQDPYRRDLAYDRLLTSGALTVKYNNPQINFEIEYEIKQYRNELEMQKKFKAEEAAEEPEDAIDPEPEKPEETSTIAPPQTQAPGAYDYLRAKELDTGKGSPKIDLGAGDSAQMRVGELSPREYFALQADPVLAQQQLEVKQEPKPEPEQKVALQQRRPAALQV